MDSTGIFQVTKERQINWLKHCINASDFVATTEGRTACNRANNMSVNVGHVRHATSGAKTTANAHPFEITRADGSTLIGVHNGSLNTGWKYKPHAKEFEVDSEWMLHLISLEGADAFEHFSGAFALVWYDSREPNKIFMARNKERPLCYMVSEDGKNLMGSSELGMLVWLAGRNGFKLAKTGPYTTPFYLEEGFIYKFDLLKLGEFEKHSFPEYKYTSAYPTNNYSQGDYRYQGHLTHYRDSTYTATGPRYLNDEFLEDDEVDLWGVANKRTTTKAEDDYEFSIQESILNGVKSALQEVRYSVTKKEAAVLEGEYQVVDEDALDRALHKSIMEMKEQPKQLTQAVDLDGITILSANTSSATKGEIKEAKELGIFGRVVEFCGIDYDDTLSECLGYFEFKDLESGETSTFDGVIRYIPKKVADDLYIERQSHIAILVGWNKAAGWAVCTTPDPQQKAFIYGNRTLALDKAQTN